MNAIQNIRPTSFYRPNSTPAVQGTSPEKSFQEMLLDSIRQMNMQQMTQVQNQLIAAYDEIKNVRV